MISFSSISKSFGGAAALREVSLDVLQGSCHALVGASGAGKSTLANVLAGVVRADSGEVLIDGKRVRFKSPGQAMRAGVALVGQEMPFDPEISVAEHVCMGSFGIRRLGVVSRGAIERKAREILEEVGLSSQALQAMGQLSRVERKLVSVARAFTNGAHVVVLDEPVEGMSDDEGRRVFDVIAKLRGRGATVVYICRDWPGMVLDRISVMRDGRHVGTLEWEETTAEKVGELIVGGKVEAYTPKHLSGVAGHARLSVKGLSVDDEFEDVSFEVRAGEVVGLAGDASAAVARALFGLAPAARGSLRVSGKDVRPGSVKESIRAGIALVPADRRRQGLVNGLGVRENFSLGMLDRLGRLGLVNHGVERRKAKIMLERLGVRTRSIDCLPESLMVGEQQKLVLGKWLARGSRVMIFEEPTRGVDTQTRREIYGLIDNLCATGGGLGDRLIGHTRDDGAFNANDRDPGGAGGGKGGEGQGNGGWRAGVDGGAGRRGLTPDIRGRSFRGGS